MFLNSRPWQKKFFSSFVLTIFLAGLIMSGIFLPLKDAQAMRATLEQQIVQYILDQIWQGKDYALQRLMKFYSQITSQIQQWFKYDTLLQRALKDSWNMTRRSLLEELTYDVIQWAQGEEGIPNFVTDWGGYLGGLTQQAGDQFVEKELGQGNMCEVFDQYIKESFSPEPNFYQQTQCPLPNSQAFLDDFSQGGWDSWLQLIRPQGNIFGAYMIASDQKLLKESQAYTDSRDRLLANQGFKGTEETPGVIQSYAMQRASMMDLDYLLQSNDINEYLSSVVDAFINRIIREGLENMRTDEYEPIGAPPNYNIPFDDQQDYFDLMYLQSNKEYADQLIDILELTEENLEVLKEELDITLPLMEQIQGIQLCLISACGGTATTPISMNVWIFFYAGSTSNPPDTGMPFGPLDIVRAISDKALPRISLIDPAISATKEMVAEMDNVITLVDSGDDAAIQSALSLFRLKHDQAMDIYVDLFDLPANQDGADLQHASTTIREVFDAAHNYNAEVNEDIAAIKSYRGHPSLIGESLELTAEPTTGMIDNDLQAINDTLNQFLSTQEDLPLDPEISLYEKLRLEQLATASCEGC